MQNLSYESTGKFNLLENKPDSFLHRGKRQLSNGLLNDVWNSQEKLKKFKVTRIWCLILSDFGYYQNYQSDVLQTEGNLKIGVK